MASLRARGLIWLIRNRHLFKGRLRPETIGPGFDVAGFRASTERTVAKMKLPEGVAFEPVDVAGMRGEWVVPDAAAPDAVLLYIHGGGFISGGRATHRGHVVRFARAAGMRALVFDYRLAPEYPFPAAPDDVLAAYRWLLGTGVAPGRIVVGGESAGATLTLSLLVSLAAAGLPQPAGAFAISPHTDMGFSGASLTANAARDIPPPGAVETWIGLYAGPADRADPRLSPVFGDFTGVCPLLLTVGGDEVVLDDVRAVAGRAEAQGVEVEVDEVAGMVHAFVLLPGIVPEARAALARIAGFAGAVLG